MAYRATNRTKSIEMEFKGTGKGKPWSVNLNDAYLNKHGVKCVDIDCDSESVVRLATVCDGFNPKDQEGAYNALLISKAPEMLYKLKELRNYVYSLRSVSGSHLYQSIDELIKSATELKEDKL